ncbi:MAG: fused DSP-PTPase phosphatase/NAD kinase-like protein [Planctomycetia bacterium]
MIAGKKSLEVLGFVLVVVALVLPIQVANYQKKQFRNFHVVNPNVIYRSGQMPLPAIHKIINDFHIKSIVSLRDSYDAGKAPPDAAEEKFAQEYGLKYLRLTPKKWESESGETPPILENISKYLELISDPANLPVLVHCFAGIHRTGAYCAIYRMEFEGWSNDKVIDELKKMGYYQIEKEKDVYDFIKNYKPKSISEIRKNKNP